MTELALADLSALTREYSARNYNPQIGRAHV